MSRASGERLTVTATSDRGIVMSRVFDAPRQLVFDAWTKPELFTRWFGRRDWTVPVCEMDVRPGGAYRYVLRGPDGTEIVMRGTYREVVPPERLVTTEAFEGFSEVGWRPEDETVSTMVLTERDGKTTWTSTVLYPSKEIRDAALDLKPAWTGMGESLDRLAGVLGEASRNPASER
jgi:uncharacterized protein YndB with AHSA1/START domain